MITVSNVDMPKYYGKSTDTKPTGITGGNGSKFTEIDTHEVFYYDEEGDQWCALPSPETPADG